jgi:hypothetical protein
MPFVATIVEDTSYFTVQIENNSYRVASQIGYDGKTKHTYYLALYLDIVPAWGYELRYCIEERVFRMELSETGGDRSELKGEEP